MSMFIRDRFSPMNVGLAVVVLAGLAYVSWSLLSKEFNSVPANSYPQVKLTDSLNLSSDVTNLNKDLKTINTAIKQETLDIQAASKISSLKPDSLNMQTQSMSSWLNLAMRELYDSEFISQAAKSQLAAALSRLQAKLTPYKSKQVSLSSQKAFVNQYQTLLPRIAEIKVFDDQQAAESLLAQLSGILSRSIIQAGVKGVVATDYEADLTTLAADATSGAKLSKASENKLVANGVMTSHLQANLTAAKLDIAAAQNAAEMIAGGL